MNVDVRILGPLQLVIDGVDVTPAAPKERALLALLAVSHPQAVSVDRLAEELWSGLPPERGRRVLQVRVAALRKHLKAFGAASVLERAPPGYRLALPEGAIDVQRFATLVEQAGRQSASDDAAAAAASLDDALALWRGEPLADVQASRTLEDEADRLREAHLGAVEDRIEADLACGRHHAVLPELDGLVTAHPLREGLCAQRVLALYRCGRQAEALRACASIRRRLVEELGVLPGPGLRALEAAVLEQRPELEWPPEAGPPLGETDTGAIVPLPGRLALSPATGVVGREAEMEAMADAFKRVAAGDGREVVLVSGEAGLGKTTLVAETARAAFDAGACVLLGHCEEDLTVPYQLFTEALGHFVTHAAEDELVAHVEAYGSEVVQLAPALARRLPGLPPSKATDPDTERYLLFAAVVGLLGTVSEHQPVVLVVEDLQWADKASLQLLRHLVAADRPMRLLVLGTYRDSGLSRAHPLLDTLATLHRHHGVARMELTGLDDTGVLSLMEAAAGHTLDDAAASVALAVYRETDGNPFFVSEMLRHLSETGAIAQDASGCWVAADILDELVLPASVRVVIGARIGRLGHHAERVLALASVVGRDFDLEVLARATETSEDDLLDVLDAATAAALVRELPDTPGHYSFAHALIQHTLYEGLGPTRRARAHRRVAEALEDVCGDRPGARVGELARHWVAASHPMGVAKALDYSRQAADAALSALAPADALRYYAQALDLYARSDNPDPLLGIDLAVGLGTAQRQTGDPAFRETLLDAARRAADLGDTERLVAAALANDRGFLAAIGAIDADKVEILETALDRLSTDNPDRALVLATECMELTMSSSLDRRQALADEALAIAKSFGDDAIIVRVLHNVLYPLLVPHVLEQSLAWSADALARAERLGDPVLMFWSAQGRSQAAARAEDIDEMDRCIDIAGSLAEQLNQPILSWMHSWRRALRAMIAGDTDQVEQLATEALRIGTESGQPDASILFAVQLGAVNFQRGTMGRQAPLTEQVEQAAAALPDIPRLGIAGGLALALVEDDRSDDARHLLEEFAAAGFDLPLDSNWLIAMIGYAEVAIACRDPKYAGPLFDRLAPWADQLSTTAAISYGPVSYFLGGLATVLDRYDEAEAYFTQAAAFNDRAGAKFFAARTNLSWGKMLAERKVPGDTERARDLLTTAHAAAAKHGYANVERRAAQALDGLD